MSGNIVRNHDVSNIDSNYFLDRSIAGQYSQRNQNVNNSSGVRHCRICLKSDSKNGLASWVHPCRCEGSAKWIHNQCLLRWIDARQRGNHLKPVACPQCNTIFKINCSSMGFIANFLEKCNLTLERSYLLLITSTGVTSIYWGGITYGTVTLVQIFGFAKTLSVFNNVDPFFLFLFLPMIPVTMIFGRALEWESYVIRIFRRIPLLNYLIGNFDESHEDENLSGPLESALIDTSNPKAELCGALSLPTFSCFTGYMFYGSVKNDFLRAILGGVTFVIVKGVLNSFIKRQKLMKTKTRTVLNYTKENMIKYGIPLPKTTNVSADAAI